MTETIDLIFRIILLIVAVFVGLWFGSKVAENTRDEHGRPRRSLLTALRETATTGAIKAWKWNRSRGRAKSDKE